MSKCQLPPSGWKCTRDSGHRGPCAAVPTILESLTNEYQEENNALRKAYLNPPVGMNPCESVREELYNIIISYERDINYIFRVKRITDYALENFT